MAKMPAPDNFENFASDTHFREYFNFGPYADDFHFRMNLWHEVVTEGVYERFRSVRPGDVVLDIGANMGLFPYTLRYSKPSLVICLEPSEELYPILVNNLSKLPYKTIPMNSGIAKTSGEQKIKTNTDHIYLAKQRSQETFRTIDIRLLLHTRKVDFMKIDCEGYEYDVFTKDNVEFICDNVGYVAGEFHLGPDVENSVERFNEFRNNYLLGNDVKVFEIYHTPKEIVDITKRHISYFWKDSTNEVLTDSTYAQRYSDFFGKDAQLMVYINFEK